MNRILIRAANWVGDAVMSLPAIRAVAARFPAAEIHLLARPWVADLYARETCIRSVIPYTPAPGRRELRAKWSFARSLRAGRFDLAILLPNSFESAAVARLAAIPKVVGYARDGRDWLLTQPIQPPRPGEIPRHERFYYLELLRRAGLLEGPLPDGPIRLENRDEAARSGRLLLEQRGVEAPVIGVSPGAAYGNAKQWVPDHFAAAASSLAARHRASVALFGSPSERDLCERVARAIGPRAHNLAGQTSLREFVDLAASSVLFLTNDSGAMHIASALGVPTVTVFGATDHTTTGPTGDHATVVREQVECSPCLLRDCPIDHRCMTRVPPGRVIDEATLLLGR